MAAHRHAIDDGYLLARTWVETDRLNAQAETGRHTGLGPLIIGTWTTCVGSTPYPGPRPHRAPRLAIAEPAA